jgi:CDP-diacylglycerol--glycerol-3-phosphate 3-phosphatidyltransferase
MHVLLLFAAVIIGREISMSALREWAATMGPAAKAAVAVNNWGKWKTASQVGVCWRSLCGACCDVLHAV